jgi:chemotaxis protein methyltransferase CheR
MSITPVEFDYLRKLMAEHTAIVLDSGKEYIAESRLAHLVAQEGFHSIRELIHTLRSQAFAELHRKVVNAMTNNETWFFRDLVPFRALQKVVIPALLAARAADRRLSIWCAACSTGQEPYSIAMLLREHFPELQTWKVKILATDISTSVLERAQRGQYSQIEVNRGLPAPMLERYFTRDGPNWTASHELRRAIDFQTFNLAGTWNAFAIFDLIFMRNVLIYFDVEKKKTILGNLRRCLRCDGHLFLGGAETTYNLDPKFDRVQYETTAYYRPLP